MALNDIQKDSGLYSGWNRYRAWGADLTPIIAGIAGGSAGFIFGVPAAGGILGGIHLYHCLQPPKMVELPDWLSALSVFQKSAQNA